MITDKLVMMANQIAANNSYLTDGAAAKTVATHINQFWTPQMRQELEQVAESSAGDAGTPDDLLSPVVREALTQLR